MMDGTDNLSPAKRIPVWAWIGIFLGGAALMYCAGWVVVLTSDLEYRLWANTLGLCLCFLLIPLWGVCVAVWLLWRRIRRKIIVVPLAILLAAVYCWWSSICGLIILFTMQSEQRESTLEGKYFNKHYLLVGVNNVWLEPSVWAYSYYEVEALVFRRPCEDSGEIEQRYLEGKYGEPFRRKTITEEMKAYTQKEYWLDSDVGWFSESRPDVPVNVWISTQKLQDDYVNMAANKLFYETWVEQGLQTEYIWDNGYFTLLLKEEEIDRFCEEVQILLTSAESDTLLQEWRVSLHYLVSVDGLIYHYYGGDFPAGKLADADRLEEGYYLDEKTLREEAQERIEGAKDRAALQAEWQEESEGSGSGEWQAEEKPETSTEDPYYQEAEKIYLQEVKKLSEDTAVVPEICYNAKGFPYYYLGEDGTYAYTLIYDRDSANGACRLYVLYKSPRDGSGEGYVSYTDTGTLIENVYAYVIETGEIIASGRQAWADVGTEEYREATGE